MSNVFQNLQLQRIANAIEDGSVTGSITIDVTGAGDMQPATATAAGAHGLVPAPQAGDENKVLSGAGVWVEAGGGELGDLKDVELTSPTSGESLKYDGSKWVNGNVTADLPDFIEETSGSIVTVEAAERPAKSLKVAINPVQSGSGDPSPENVRPISGWSACNVFVSQTQNAEDGTTYTIEFKDGGNPLTVYDGALDVTNGTLTVDRIEKAMPINWSINTASSMYWLLTYIISDAISVENTDTSIRVLSDGFKGVTADEILKQMTITSNYVNCIAIISSKRLFLKVKKADYPTLNDLYSMIETNNLRLVYELATPQTYQLTPTVVQMLLGTNNIWADTGEITELKYIPQTYDDLIKEVSGGGEISYSITEQNTGIKWIDGKYIYQRSFDIAGAQYSSPNYVTLANVSGIDLLINAQCVVYEGTEGTVVPDINQRLCVVSGGDIKIYTETSWSLTRGSHLTVWYTKI